MNRRGCERQLGAVLPGVTIEAASPARIEATRTAVSDRDGQYKIVDLRPGVYTVTFTLTGFRTVMREGIRLPASFTATIDAELAVGQLEETLTVTGEAPLVDTRNFNDGLMHEISYQTSSLPAEAPVGGVQINMIPRDGGNEVHGSAFATGANEDMQSNNLSQDLIDRGFRAHNRGQRTTCSTTAR